ncbi:hypothetical protein CCR75_004579 [Bremia lactucae]|uniref:Uncharacterized protein n=1 Tax=Bremia lactucae TaxID=4779 RepID=A0A976IEA0_BRELC|nr:hypothetical protein CCR75_004579 [Bremia lactucae]
MSRNAPKVEVYMPIKPTVPLTKELEALYEFMTHQKIAPTAGDREFNGWCIVFLSCRCCVCLRTVLLTDLAKSTEKELDIQIRELENWNFRLNLDEGASWIKGINTHV